MSRIEEALRRANGGAAVVAVPADESRNRRRGVGLEQYAAEATPAPTPAPGESDLETVTRRANRVLHGEPHLPAPQTRVASQKLVTSADASPASIEQYRRLATTLYHGKGERGLKSVMVCSALPREGKTLTAANLALTLSESYGQRVLLIDADLRGASTHSVFDLPIAPGLGDFLDSLDLPLPIAAVSKTLSVVPAGTCSANPLAALVSDRMKGLVEQATARFDWVVLDTPPVGVLSDANLLAALTDAVVFVVAAGSTPYPLVRRAIHDIGAERVIGVVLNRVSESTMPSTTYYERYAPRPAAPFAAD
jgi:capsular exopolysaccharide synthesis family protein